MRCANAIYLITISGPRRTVTLLIWAMVLSSGKLRAYRDIACINAATALVATKNEKQLGDAFKRAEAAIDSGAAKGALDQLVTITNS